MAKHGEIDIYYQNDEKCGNNLRGKGLLVSNIQWDKVTRLG